MGENKPKLNSDIMEMLFVSVKQDSGIEVKLQMFWMGLHSPRKSRLTILKVLLGLQLLLD